MASASVIQPSTTMQSDRFHPHVGEAPGAFQLYLDDAGLGWFFKYRCPCGCGCIGDLPCEAPGETVHTGKNECFWMWDGNLAAPTISPSVRHLDRCKVHFNLEAGKWRMHADGPPAAPGVQTTA